MILTAKEKYYQFFFAAVLIIAIVALFCAKTVEAKREEKAMKNERTVNM